MKERMPRSETIDQLLAALDPNRTDSKDWLSRYARRYHRLESLVAELGLSQEQVERLTIAFGEGLHHDD